jgi:Protein of unknown function (DUF3592)
MKAFWDLLRAAGFGLILLALLALLFGAWVAYRPYSEMNGWPAVDAEVVQSMITSRLSHPNRFHVGNRLRYGASFIFRYTVNGEQYLAQKEIGYDSSSQDEMAAWVRRYADGSHRTIRYDPANPLRVSLAAGFDAMSFAPTLVMWRWSAILGAIGIALLFLANRLGANTQKQFEAVL